MAATDNFCKLLDHSANTRDLKRSPQDKEEVRHLTKVGILPGADLLPQWMILPAWLPGHSRISVGGHRFPYTRQGDLDLVPVPWYVGDLASPVIRPGLPSI